MQMLTVHPTHPEKRLMKQVSGRLHAGGLVRIATASGLLFVCDCGFKKGVKALNRLVQVELGEQPGIITPGGLGEVAEYFVVSNPVFRQIKRHMEEAQGFILPASVHAIHHLDLKKGAHLALRLPRGSVVESLLACWMQPLYSICVQDMRTACRQVLGALWDVDVHTHTHTDGPPATELIDLTAE